MFFFLLVGPGSKDVLPKITEIGSGVFKVDYTPNSPGWIKKCDCIHSFALHDAFCFLQFLNQTLKIAILIKTFLVDFR